jgi:hypothetical protein
MLITSPLLSSAPMIILARTAQPHVANEITLHRRSSYL